MRKKFARPPNSTIFFMVFYRVSLKDESISPQISHDHLNFNITDAVDRSDIISSAERSILTNRYLDLYRIIGNPKIRPHGNAFGGR